MSKRTINWVCTAEADWEWRSGSPGNPGFPTGDDGIREGSVTLPPNEDYWYPCVDLVLQGKTIGNAYLRYFQDSEGDKIQAITVAQNIWISEGEVNGSSSVTKSNGGINLKVTLPK